MAEESGETESFVIGGAQIYAQSLPLADRLEITAIDAEAPDADVFFPEITPEEWKLAEESPAEIDEKTGVTYRFRRYLSTRR